MRTAFSTNAALLGAGRTPQEVLAMLAPVILLSGAAILAVTLRMRKATLPTA